MKYWQHYEIVSYKIAKLAEEKGFDWETNELSDKLYLYEGEMVRNTLSVPFGYKGEQVKAPSATLLQRWLRERHNIDIHVYLIEISSNGIIKMQSSNEREYSYYIQVHGEPLFISYHDEATYDKAHEMALEEALNQIE